MNRQMQMREDEFRTDDEKDAWQQGYISSIEVSTNLHQDSPENLHGALCAGWWCAFEDATKRRPRTPPFVALRGVGGEVPLRS